MYEVRESKQGQTVDALALGGDEGRDKLRKAREAQIAVDPGYPNGNPGRLKACHPVREANVRELKHLSTHRRRK